ncbi:MAG: gliding motility-associated C-terminal domain-containing protein [Ferruginibacter sp.]
MKKLLFLLLLISNHCISQVKPGNIFPIHKPVVNKPQHDPPETINRYAAVLAFDICTNTITVSDATEFNPGDTVLMIQMKGAVIDTSNTPAFGTILDYGNAGNYEFNFISAKSGNALTFLNKLTRDYDIPDGVVQLVRVPKYKDGYFSGGLVPLTWDGATGGIVCVYATLSVTAAGEIDASRRGFRGGTGYNASGSPSCNQNNYYYPASSQFAANKGESIGSISQNMTKGKSSFAGGGGGGSSHNSGGGGGGNGGVGGHGGYQSDSCNAIPFDNGGVGGKSLQYSPAINKIFMGSGGGAGDVDNADQFAPTGGAGGGIIIIITDVLDLYGERVLADGEDGLYCNSTNCNDGNSGGGAGGTILLSAASVITPLNIEAKGGKGASMYGTIVPGGRAGPGGGGGGGVLFNTGNTLPANITYIPNGGVNGVIFQDANNPWGATAGAPGINFFDWVIPYDTILFTPNIDSVRIKDSANYCNNIQFNGLGYTNTYPVSSWQWTFGDGGTANTQNPIHNYNAVGNYTVKLIVTDINGCKDSIITSINTTGPMLADAGTDSSFCADGQISIVLNGNGTGNYSWTPAAVLNNNTLQNPTATINTTTKFYLTVSNGTGCSAVDSVTITVNKNPLVKTLADTTICKNGLLVLTTNGAVNYNWSPGIYVNDSTIANPQYIDTGSHTLFVTGIDINGCSAKDTINISVRNRVTFIAPESKTICKGTSVQLNGNNGNTFQYTWSPSSYLSNAAIINPVANPPFTIAYTLKVTDNICKNDSSFVVDVLVLPAPTVKATKSNDLNCNKPFAQLRASGAASYTWIPSYALSNDSIADPLANPAVTTTYYVNGRDSSICIGTDSITVVANFKNHGIILPNSFTPNNDGLNDCFGIRYYRDVKNLDFIIFNRYGNIVFHTHNADECWDGNYKGKPASPGSYVYFIKANTLCGEVVIKESIMLIR